jgi:hypothetical protein
MVMYVRGSHLQWFDSGRLCVFQQISRARKLDLIRATQPVVAFPIPLERWIKLIEIIVG